MMVLVSLVLIALNLFVCDRLRGVVTRYLHKGSLARSLILDFLLAVELCTVSFEMGVILDHYGFAAWGIGLFGMATYQVLRWKDHAMPSPYVHLLDHLTGSKSIVEVLLRSLVLVASGLLTYRYVKVLWRLEMSSLHVGRPDALDSCKFPWTEVPVHHSFLAELLGSFLLGVAPRLVLENPSLSNNDPLYPALIVASIVFVTVTAALEYSGGLFNPMLASVLFGGCSGHSILEHFFVYWIGSTLGAICAFKVYPFVKQLVYGTAQEDVFKKAI